MSKSYADKLRDPRWQRMRLEIMQRDGFKCLECGDTGETLNVDHGFYEYGRAPWEYPEWSLRTLCQTHHEHIGKLRKDLKMLVAAMPIKDVERMLRVAVTCEEPEPRGITSKAAQIKMKLVSATSHEEAIRLLREFQSL